MTPPTGTSEKALEQLIVRHLVGSSEHPSVAANIAADAFGKNI